MVQSKGLSDWCPYCNAVPDKAGFAEMCPIHRRMFWLAVGAEVLAPLIIGGFVLVGMWMYAKGL